MTTVAHTLYTLTLFLSLAALRLWSERRHRAPRVVREGAPTV